MDSSHMREVLAGDGAWISFTTQTITFSFNAKELTLKNVLDFHPRATAINAAEAIAALDADRGEGFRLELRPDDDPCFGLALPSRMGGPVPPPVEWEVALWSVPGITQPGTITESNYPVNPESA
ncbi:hypothetical protein AB0M45_30190 [Nocardia sp. NPDC051787]|uniref:hypothetical protein n=1 Tax=Nocardia sp. NPDC051787 TaxID=3155415 RepID=UPI003439E321